MILRNRERLAVVIFAIFALVCASYAVRLEQDIERRIAYEERLHAELAAVEPCEPVVEIVQAQRVTAVVTAYAPFDNQSGMCNDGDPTNTATGTYPDWGTLAADPARVPYGTILYIPGYGMGEAKDTGGALRRDAENIRIDIYVDTYEQARAWGVRELEIVVIEGRVTE